MDTSDKDREKFSTAVNTLEQTIKEYETGKVITYNELKKIADLDVKKYRHILESVKTRLLRHHSLRLISIRKVGYKLTGATESKFQISETIDCTKMNKNEQTKTINEQINNAVSILVFKSEPQKITKLLINKK